MEEYLKKADVMKALQEERELLCSFHMWGAESTLVHYAINVIDELPTTKFDEEHLRQAVNPHT